MLKNISLTALALCIMLGSVAPSLEASHGHAKQDKKTTWRHYLWERMTLQNLVCAAAVIAVAVDQAQSPRGQRIRARVARSALQPRLPSSSASPSSSSEQSSKSFAESPHDCPSSSSSSKPHSSSSSSHSSSLSSSRSSGGPSNPAWPKPVRLDLSAKPVLNCIGGSAVAVRHTSNNHLLHRTPSGNHLFSMNQLGASMGVEFYESVNSNNPPVPTAIDADHPYTDSTKAELDTEGPIIRAGASVGFTSYNSDGTRK